MLRRSLMDGFTAMKEEIDANIMLTCTETLFFAGTHRLFLS
jgi:hypothetical protein